MGRDWNGYSLRSFMQVSIHAPAWGATSNVYRKNLLAAMFQSTRPRGARPEMTGGSLAQQVFQSTRPRGARQCMWFEARTKNLFQSTRPRGARHTVGAVLLDAEAVSIHAPAWGATGQAGK